MADLRVVDLEASYGSVRALRGVSIDVEAGACAAILGANGSGKSTLLKAITGLVPFSGAVYLGGAPAPRSPERIARAGIGHVLESGHVFTALTVRENLELGAGGAKKAERAARIEVLIDAFPLLKDKLARYGGELSGGERQTVAIARALMAQPKVLLMDEPSLGLAPIVIERLGEAINRVRAELSTTLLVAEQSIPLALNIASYFYVLQRGRVSYEGAGDVAVLWNEVHRAYLGSEPAQSATSS